MANCIFQIRRGDSRMIGIQQFDPQSDNPWASLRESLQRCSVRYRLHGAPANDADAEDMVVTVGILEMAARPASRLSQSIIHATA